MLGAYHLAACLAALATLIAAEAPKPHILLLLADDYGWANIGIHNDGSGAHGRQLQGEIQTPNMDQLIRDGILLDRHYSFRICSPARSSLMSGRLPMHVNWVNTGITDHNPQDPVSGSGGIPRNMTGMARKLKSAGYRTHMVGKWDAGALTPEHTPLGRGFESFVGYMQHANDYWQEGVSFTSMGEVDVCLNKFVDLHIHNASFKGGVTPAIAREMKCTKDTVFNQSATVSLTSQTNATGCINSSYCLPEECYEEAMLRHRAMEIIEHHNSSEPLFLFYASHLLHTPLQVPESYLARVDSRLKGAGLEPFDSENRRLYAAMTSFLDDVVGDLVASLKTRGMWDKTLVIFTADNGGPIYDPGSASNYPLKGGKFSDWEGGIRTNAFVSGGFVPAARRGTKHEGVVSIADWYGLVSELAGVDQHDVAAEDANKWLRTKGLPLLRPVDSVPQWKHIIEGTNGRPGSLFISDKALLRYPWKLVTGDQVYSVYAGQLYPNCSTIRHLAERGPVMPTIYDVQLFGEKLNLGYTQAEVDELMDVERCGVGKLYNVAEDPSERHDLSRDPAHAEIFKDLRQELAEFNKNVFSPNRGSPDMEACRSALRVGGFYGPFVDAAGFFSPVRLTPRQRANNRAARRELDYVERVLLPNRTKQIAFFYQRVGDATQLFKGPFIDKCFRQPAAATSAVLI